MTTPPHWSPPDDAPTFPAPDEHARYVQYGPGLGYVHGYRVKRVTPCGIYVWPDDDGRRCPREVTTRPGDRITCPRCMAALAATR